MPEIRVTLTVEVDGQALPDMPLVKRVIMAEAVPIANIIATPDSNTTSYHGIAAATMADLGFFYLTFDQAVNLKINVNTPLSMDAGGFILFVQSELTQGTPANNVQYNNPSSTVDANLGGLVAGT